jgi:poly(hydroxyalkanoate) depolymerase family esterase
LKNRLFAGMPGVLQLTRAGRLQEATAAIQSLLRGQSETGGNAEPALRSEREPIEGIFRVIDPEPVRTAETPQPQPRPSLDAGALEGKFLAASYTNKAGTRAYKLYVPRGFHGQMLPLVVMLHGCKQNPDDFAIGTRMNQVADEQMCFVLYPAQTRTANQSRCWNWFRESDQRRDRGEPSIIAGITRLIMNTYPVDPQRVYVAGLSAGGAMAVTMGMTYPDIYAAIGVHSGLAYGVARDVPSAFAAMRKARSPQNPAGLSDPRRSTMWDIPAIVFHGDADATVHPVNGEQVIAQSRDLGAENRACKRVQRDRVPDGYAYTRTNYEDTEGRTIVEHWVVHGGGHAWFGGNSKGSFTDPKGPDATQEMIRFFYAHVRSTRH